MSKQKYNWNKLKAEFLQSEYHEVQPFLRYKKIVGKGVRNGNADEHTLGWREEKERIGREIVKKVSKELQKQGTDALNKLDRGLYNLAGLVMPGLMNRITKKAKDENNNIDATKIEIGIEEAATIWRMIMIRQNQPTEINKDIIRDETMTPEEEIELDEELDKILANEKGDKRNN